MTPSRAPLLPWLILGFMLALTWMAWDHERQNARKELRSQFEFALRDAVGTVDQRVASYEQTLRGVQALLATTGLDDRQAIHRYVESIRLDANFSGIHGISIIAWSPSSAPGGPRRLGLSAPRDAAPIIQREPADADSHAVVGFDCWSDPVRRVALERSRDSGTVAITGKLRLAADKGSEPTPGFVMFLPVYAQGKSTGNVAERRSSLVGWVSAAIHMSDFMASLYGNPVPGLAYAVYDGVTPSPETLMFRSSADAAGLAATPSPGGWSGSEYLVAGGHNWTLELTARDEFEARFGRNASLLIALTGSGLSLAMALLAWFMLAGRSMAQAWARKMTEELRHMAQHDPLTHLPNRALFSDRLQQVLAHAKRTGAQFAVMFLDLDDFKPVNDDYGHAVGDVLLQQVAIRLKALMRAEDTIGRVGGDEFVILISGLNGPESASGLMEKIRQAVDAPYVVEGHELKVSCSMGIAIYPDDGDDEITLCKHADTAMYRAKRARHQMQG